MGLPLILHRYINRQVFMTTVLVTFILVMVLVSGRFIKYLAEAAAGEIAADALFLVMAFRMPEFLQMIVPLSLYIALLLVLGRMHMDNEMVVLQAGGQGNGRVVRSLVVPILMATTLVGMFSLYVTPRGDAEVNRIFEEQKDRSVLELLTPGRFHVKGSSDSQRATYAEHLNREKGVLENVFVADARFESQGEAGRLLTVWAKSGKLVVEEGISYLLLTDGFQYQGKPGQLDYKEVGFKEARVRIGGEKTDSRPPKVRGRSTQELVDQRADNKAALAELQWRLSLILTVPIMALAAIPLARVNPRQGRFYRLIPAVLGYMLYVGMLLVCRSAIEDHKGAVPWYLSMVWIHLSAGAVVFLLYFGGRLFRRRARS
ncbi:LPS export ABC transporter permease LptF [Alcanivorax sp.]|uniref:LPS export ABC transporter permease LptF n=1 Tax=Alcanivorax sp. TaxID=1872427 RepID=UPI0025C00BD2|nr:LPS export ABC transporter permease LptF [Alcanivorax sp.]